MMGLMGNECNLEARREAERERREFQIRVIYFGAGVFAGVILTIIAIVK